MHGRGHLLREPPYQLERALKTLGENLRTARLRRNLTIAEVAAKLGVHRHVVASAEAGKPATSVAVYAGLLWVMDLVDQLAEVGAPHKDVEGEALAKTHERTRARTVARLDDDF